MLHNRNLLSQAEPGLLGGKFDTNLHCQRNIFCNINKWIPGLASLSVKIFQTEEVLIRNAVE